MAKTPAQARLDEVVAKALAPILKEAGYRKSGRTFRRKNGSCVQVVNVQASAWSSADSLKFTVNLGVFFEEVSAANPFWQSKVGEAGPDVWSCHVRERIGNVAR